MQIDRRDAAGIEADARRSCRLPGDAGLRLPRQHAAFGGERVHIGLSHLEAEIGLGGGGVDPRAIGLRAGDGQPRGAFAAEFDRPFDHACGLGAVEAAVRGGAGGIFHRHAEFGIGAEAGDRPRGGGGADAGAGRVQSGRGIHRQRDGAAEGQDGRGR